MPLPFLPIRRVANGRKPEMRDHGMPIVKLFNRNEPEDGTDDDDGAMGYGDQVEALPTSGTGGYVREPALLKLAVNSR